MGKIHIENGIISSSADYSLFHGTSKLAIIEPGAFRVQGDLIAENYIVSSSVTFMTTSFSDGSTRFGNSDADTHHFQGIISSSVGGSTNNNSVIRATGGGARLLLDSVHNETTTGVQFLEGAFGTEASINYNHATDTMEFKGSGTNTTLVSIDTSGDIELATNDAKIKADSTNTLNIQAHQLKILGSGGEERFQLQSEGNDNPGVFMIKQSEVQTTIQLNSAGDSFLNGGNVGIGTSNPAGNLEIVGGNGTVSGTPESDGNEFVIRNNDRAGMSILAGEGTGDTSNVVFGSTSDMNGASLNYEFNAKLFRMQSQHPSSELSLASANNVEAVRIDTSQRVGIGVSSPAQRLHVSQSSGTAALIDGDGNGNNPILHVRDRADTFVALFEGNRAGDTGAAVMIRHNPASPASSNRTRLNFQMPDNGGTATTYAQFASFIDSNTNTSEEGHLKINTMTGGSVTEHLHIGNNKISGSAASTGSFGSVHTGGQVGVQTTAPKKGLTVKATGNDDGIALLASNGQYVALIHQQDSDAGMLRLHDDSSTTKIAFNADNGGNSFFNNDNGKVGIGTDNPQKDLHIHQNNSNALHEALTIRTNSSGEGLALGVNADNSSYVVNSDSGNALHLGGSSSTINNTGHLTVDGGGNIGIGTGSPTQKLDIRGGNLIISASGGSGVIFKGTGDGSNKNALYFKNASNTEKFRIIHDPSANGTDDLQFKANANSVPVMTMLQNGNVGIGTSSPDSLLHLETGGKATLRMTNSTTSTTDETEIGTIEFEGKDSSTNRSGVMAKITSRYSDTGTAGGSTIDGGGNEGGNIGFFTSIATSVGGSQTLAEKMRIENNGNIGIGTGNTNPKTHLDIQSYQADGITIGADNDANRTRTNSTVKSGGITGVHYTNAEENIRIIGYDSTSDANKVYIGGANGDWNAATQIDFYTAANFNTVTGTLRFRLDSNSRISLSNNDSGGTGGSDSTSANTLLGFLAGDDIASGGVNNSFVGHAAGHKNTTGDSNSGFGRYAGFGNLTGDNNTFVGSQAGLSDNGSSHSNNTGVGFEALKVLTTGGSNTAVGVTAGDSITSANFNVAVGLDALGQTTTGGANVAVGYQAMEGDADGDGADNVAIGHKAMLANVSPSKNVAIGDSAMRAMNGTANGIAQCVAIGANAFFGDADNTTTNTDGTTAIGYNSLFSLTTGQQNTAIGSFNSDALTTGGFNTSVGRSTLGALTAGSHNVALGRATLTTAADDESDNIAIGNSALGAAKQDGTASSTNREVKQNIAIGTDALIGGTLTGARHLEGNVAIGYQALDATGANEQIGTVAIGTMALSTLTDGQFNVAIGYESQKFQSDGTGNTTLGYQSFRNADNGESFNVVIGHEAGEFQNHAASDGNVWIGGEACVGGTGNRDYSVAIGYRAWSNAGTQNNIGGSENIFIGAYSGNGTWATAASDQNTAVGYQTMAGNMNGAAYNSAFGFESLNDLTTGDYNTAIGYKSADALTTGTQNTALGSFSFSNSTEAARVVAIGYAASNASLLANGEGSVAIGYAALNNHQQNVNTAVGYQSGKNCSTGGNNTALGYNTLGGNNSAGITGTNNTTIGHQAGRDMEGAVEGNVLVGKNAGLNMTTAANNTLVGTNAGDALIDETHNVAVGTDALGGSSLVDQTVVIGSQAGMGAMEATADGTVIVGYGAGASVTSGEGNTLIGFGAGTDITTGGANTIIGYQALINAQTNVGNSTVIGYKAGQKLGDNGLSDHSEHNIIIGSGTMDGGHDTLANNTANLNIAIGNNALGGNTGTSTSLTAASNTVIGHDAMKVVSSGVDNVVVGKDAGDSITTGQFNTIIGKGADVSAASGENQIVIGRAVIGTGNNETVIGGSSQTKVTFGGDTAITSSAGSSMSSGTIIANDFQVKTSISGFGDSDTKIELGSDTIDFTAGNVKMLSLKEGSSDSVVINDDSNDVNFRVESDGESSMLKVDGGTNRVGIAQGTPEGLLHVGFTGAAFGPSTPTAALYVETPDYAQPALYTKTPTSDAGTTKVANKMEFGDTAVNSGSVILDLDFSGDSSLNSNHNFIRFQSGAGIVGSINDDVAYSTFTGTHISQRPSGSSYDDWRTGMIVKSTGNIIATGSSISLAWPEVELTTTQKDKAVMGVFSMTTQDDFEYAHLDRTLPRIHYNALGEGMIRVTDTGGNIETGDYICSSTRTGHGEKQDDDLMHNYTVAKATQPYNFTSASNDADLGYKSVLIACTYHCG